MYKMGHGTTSDYKQAYSWFSVAAASAYSIANASVQRNLLGRFLKPEDLSSAQALGDDYFKSTKK